MIQKSLIGKVPAALTVETATKFLKDRGYIVEKYDTAIPQAQSEIIREFYQGLNTILGPARLVFLNVQDTDDQKAIDRFTKKALRFGLTKLEALNQLKVVVKLLFSEYNELGLNKPPTSLSFLLSHNGNWIIDKLLMIEETKIRDFDSSPEAIAYKESIYELEDEAFFKLQKERHNKLLKE